MLWRLSKDEENSSSEKGLIFEGFRLCGMTRAGLESDYGSAKTVQRLKIFVSTRINARLEIIVSLVDAIVGFHRDLRRGVPQNCIADIRIILCSFAVQSFEAISIQTHIQYRVSHFSSPKLFQLDKPFPQQTPNEHPQTQIRPPN